jgi:antirestriction protein ArdC
MNAMSRRPYRGVNILLLGMSPYGDHRWLTFKQALHHLRPAEAILKGMQDAPTIREHGNSTWYRPRDDLVQVPPLKAFRTPDGFYSTLFHELGHATGHERRLARPNVTGEIRFGSGDYCREELVAKLMPAFPCGTAGPDNSHLADFASYIKGWLTARRADNEALVVASTQAQKVPDFKSCTPAVGHPD